MTDDALRTTWGFTEADLVSNRAGKLSPTQQAKMTKTKGQSQIVNLVFGAIFLVMIVVIGVIVLPPLLAPQPANSSAVPPGIIVLGLIFVVGVIAFTVLRSRRKLTRLDGAVLMTEGEAKTREGRAGIADDTMNVNVYRLKVGSVTFPISTATQLRVFSDGQQYRVYYVKGTLPIIVAAESI
jgi:membrane protein implicated in regulation of membrane protease activity